MCTTILSHIRVPSYSRISGPGRKACPPCLPSDRRAGLRGGRFFFSPLVLPQAGNPRSRQRFSNRDSRLAFVRKKAIISNFSEAASTAFAGLQLPCVELIHVLGYPRRDHAVALPDLEAGRRARGVDQRVGGVPRYAHDLGELVYRARLALVLCHCYTSFLVGSFASKTHWKRELTCVYD